MEEQLKDMEVKSDERVKAEQRKYQEIVVCISLNSRMFCHTNLANQSFECLKSD